MCRLNESPYEKVGKFSGRLKLDRDGEEIASMKVPTKK